jgi:hypothetical protein
VGGIDGSMQQQLAQQHFMVTAWQQQLKQGSSQWCRLMAGLVGLDEVHSQVRADMWYQIF